MIQWRDVPNWQGWYQVSDAGGVRSLDRTIHVLNPHGTFAARTFRGRVLKPSRLKNGYAMVQLSRPDGQARAYVHDLVLAAFVGPKPNKIECCHGNGDRFDNRLSNLRYDTRSANALDRHKHGTFNQPRGEDQYFAKLNDEAVRYIRANADKHPQRVFAAMFGVSHNRIGEVIRGRAWQHVR